MKIWILFFCFLFFSNNAYAGSIGELSKINHLISNINNENFDFMMRKRIPNIGREFESKGKVKFVRNIGLIWVQSEPDKLTFATTKERYCINGTNGDLESLPYFSDISKLIDNVLNGNYSALDSVFKVDYSEKMPDNWELILISKDNKLKDIIKKIVVNGNSKQIIDIVIEYSNGMILSLFFTKAKVSLTDEIRC